ncbi:hypothetical protein [Teredinibacter turnerae]|uniref:hypothetical protein n=1 Tax=Teredinibacter turnerae TaxID=2426 RepID=UPI0004142947|nr:hypothetical protein [Teredinibacter turnerae]
MLIELIAVLIAAIGGIAGVFGDTWNAKEKRPTRTGWITLTVVFMASLAAGIKVIDSYDQEKKRKARETKLSYYALIEVYGPLSMWLDDFNVKSSHQDDKTKKFPPELYLDIYEKLNKHPKPLKTFGETLAKGAKNPDDTPNYSFTEAFGTRYRLIQNTLDEAINHYGSHISSETLDHLIQLRSHSLFRKADHYQSQINNKPCRGWIDQIAVDLTHLELSGAFRARCAKMLDVHLTAMTRDIAPKPPFTGEMAIYHQQYCKKIGYVRPYCAWADVRSTAGFSIEKKRTQ